MESGRTSRLGLRMGKYHNNKGRDTKGALIIEGNNHTKNSRGDLPQRVLTSIREKRR